MKSIVRVTRRGAVTLPARMRRALGLEPGDELLAETMPEGVLLRFAETLPIELYTEDRVREFDEEEAELGRYLPLQSATGLMPS